MDAHGFRDELCTMARRIARAGYCCVLPYLYYRYGTLRCDTPRCNEALAAVLTAAVHTRCHLPGRPRAGARARDGGRIVRPP